MSRIETINTLLLIQTHDASMRRMTNKSLRAMYAKQVSHLQMKRRESDVYKNKEFTNISYSHDDCRKKDISDEYK